MSELPKMPMQEYGSNLIGQRGIVVPIVTIGLLALLVVAGLALDGSHALANKTRMQNTADAAALAAAKVLDQTEDPAKKTTLATAAALSLFSINADGAGNHELNDAYDDGEISVAVQYSTTVDPFTPGSPDGPFVRVIAAGFDTQTTLSKLLGVDEIPTPATAVAGPSGPLGRGEGAQICDVAPIAVCSNDAEDGDENALRVLKPEPGMHGDVGPGNYKMIRIDDPGGNTLRQHMAGSYQKCVTVGQDVQTEPGVKSGPISQGFNTRFNRYEGAGLDAFGYPPDKYVSEQDIDIDEPKVLKSCNDPLNPTDEYIFLTDPPANNYCKDFDPYDPDYGASDYAAERVTKASEIRYNYARYMGSDPGPKTTCGGCEPRSNRRVLVLPIVTCDGNNNGQSLLPSSTFACFFMVQSLPKGQAQGAGNIFGQFLGKCEANGSAGINPGGGPGPLLYKIQLYKDPDSGDS